MAGYTSNAPASFQWSRNGIPISGQTNASLVLSNVQTANAGDYTITVTNAAGAATSAAATVAVGAAPAINVQPVAQSLVNGQSITLSVVASGNPNPAFQWQKNGLNIPGATSATLTLAAVGSSDAGSYAVTISNSAGSVTSNTVAVTVAAPNPARLTNLSILTALAPGDSFTMGFVVGGAGATGTVPLLARAAGPSLATLGVTGAHSDPQLEFFTGSTKTDANDNWGGTSALSTVFTQVGAFPFNSAASMDSALYEPAVSVGSNSVRISGVGSASGTVLAELYEAVTPSAHTILTPRLVNVSVLKDIGSGLTAGFVIGGTGSKDVLIRAVGPSLAAFGVAGSLADPKVELFDGTSKSIGVNDDWGGTAILSGAFSQVGAFPLASPTSKDSALLVTLVPGSYSVQVRSVDTTTGIVLVEVYELP